MTFGDDPIDWSKYRVESIRLNVSEPIYFAGGGASAPGASGASVTLPRAQSKPGPVIVQPDRRPDVPPPVRIPTLSHWASIQNRANAALKTITAGRNAPPAPSPRLAAPPSPAPPNREPELADVNVSLPPAESPRPVALPVRNSSTAPVQDRDQAAGRPATFDSSAGEPANILALSNDATPRSVVEVPKGVQNVPAGGDGVGLGASGSGAGNGSSRGGQGASGGGGAGSESSAAGQGSSGAGQSGSQAALSASRTRQESAPARSDVMRIEHAPSGSFDVVIMQSATRDDVRPSGATLPGPVYTVYLPVGDRREWLLDFSARPLRASAQNPYQVTVGNEGSITPPYPISTVIPADLETSPLPNAIVLQGSMTAEGILRNLRLNAPGNPLAQRILQLLSEWRFRPATRDREAIDVDVVLIIPARP